MWLPMDTGPTSGSSDRPGNSRLVQSEVPTTCDATAEVNRSRVSTRQEFMDSVDSAVQVLVLGGLATLLYGFVLGVPLAAVRSSTPQAPRALVTTHLEMLMSGPILLSLAAIVQLTGFDGTAAGVGAVLLVVGTGLLAVGGTLNWLQDVDDQFGGRSAGWKCNAVAGPTALIGLAVLAIGILSTW